MNDTKGDDLKMEVFQNILIFSGIIVKKAL